MAVQFAILLLLPYVPPLLMPTWRWLLGYAVAATVFLTIWFYAAMTQPTRTGLEAIGFVLVSCVAISTTTGTLVRTITLITGTRSATIFIHIVGAILPFAAIAIFVWANK